MENLPILQDFVPYRGRCPAAAHLQSKNCIKRGKGTADHMMPLGDWFVVKDVPPHIQHSTRSFCVNHAINLNVLQVKFDSYLAKISKNKAANGPILEVANLIPRPR